jgi:hypothetical protein
VRPRDEIDARLRAEMVELFHRYFEGVQEARFDRDLDEKSAVVGLRDVRGRLAGFSTLLYYGAEIEGEPVRVIYSGDTIVDRSAWSQGALASAWIDSVLAIHEPARHQRLFWLLICSGYRTYRFLPVFFREYYPRHDRAVPTRTQEVMASLARERFGSHYKEAAGVVRFPGAPVLTSRLRGIPPSRLTDPHVAFFARVNPGHERGDELVCLAEIAESNLTAAALRIVRSTGREVHK